MNKQRSLERMTCRSMTFKSEKLFPAMARLGVENQLSSGNLAASTAHSWLLIPELLGYHIYEQMTIPYLLL